MKLDGFSYLLCKERYGYQADFENESLLDKSIPLCVWIDSAYMFFVSTQMIHTPTSEKNRINKKRKAKLDDSNVLLIYKLLYKGRNLFIC